MVYFFLLNFLFPCRATGKLMPCPLMDPPRSVQAVRNGGKPQVSHPLVSQDSTLRQKSKDFGEAPSWLLEYNTAIRSSTKGI